MDDALRAMISRAWAAAVNRERRSWKIAFLGAQAGSPENLPSNNFRWHSFMQASSSGAGAKIFKLFIAYETQGCRSLSQFEDYQQNVILVCTAPRKECAVSV